jgi:hypothetical protein
MGMFRVVETNGKFRLVQDVNRGRYSLPQDQKIVRVVLNCAHRMYQDEQEPRQEVAQQLNRLALAVERTGPCWWFYLPVLDKKAKLFWEVLASLGKGFSPVTFLALQKLFRREAFALTGLPARHFLEDLWQNLSRSDRLQARGLKPFPVHWEVEYYTDPWVDWLLIGAGTYTGILCGKDRQDAIAVQSFLSSIAGTLKMKFAAKAELARAAEPIAYLSERQPSVPPAPPVTPRHGERIQLTACSPAR